MTKRTLFEVARELKEANKRHAELWNLRIIESDSQKQERLNINRRRKQLTAELKTYQLGMDGF